MKTLDKYIFTSLLGPFFAGFFLFVIIISIDPLISTMQRVVNEDVPMKTMFLWFINRIPQDMMYTFPMSMLLSTLLAFGRMSKDAEITAMRAGGINFFRILVPVAVFGILVTILGFLFNELVVPKTNKRARDIRHKQILKLSNPMSTENSILRTRDGAFAYAGAVNETKGEINNLLLEYYNDDGKLEKRISAPKAKYNGEFWVFECPVKQTYPKGKDTPITETLEKIIYEPLTEKPKEFARESKRTTEMSYKELKELIDTYEASRFMDTTELRVDLALKTSLPFAAFFFAIIGTSFGLTNSRGGAFIGFGVSIITIFVYYVMMSVFTALGKSGIIEPNLSAWLQNLIFFFANLILVRKING